MVRKIRGTKPAKQGLGASVPLAPRECPKKAKLVDSLLAKDYAELEETRPDSLIGEDVFWKRKPKPKKKKA